MILTHKTIVINKRELEQVKKLPFIGKKLELIYIGIGPKKSLRADKEAGAPVAIGTLSELTKNKGLEYAIEAVARIKNKNITFTVLGGDGGEQKNLEEIIEKRGVDDIVQLLGFKENAGYYLGLFDIFTLTSLKEGVPYAILEAGQAGLPVIASDVGGISEIIEDGKSGILVEPKNIEQIVEALSDLIDHPEKRKMLGENLKKKITEKFSLKTMLEKTMGLYIR